MAFDLKFGAQDVRVLESRLPRTAISPCVN